MKNIIIIILSILCVSLSLWTGWRYITQKDVASSINNIIGEKRYLEDSFNDLLTVDFITGDSVNLKRGDTQSQLADLVSYPCMIIYLPSVQEEICGSCLDFAINEARDTLGDLFVSNRINIISLGDNPEIKERIYKKKVYVTETALIDVPKAYMPYYFVLNEDGYEYNQDKTYKKKSRRYPREVEYVKTVNGKSVKAKTTVDEKQVIFWSADYVKRAKAERQPAIDKARDLIGNVQKYNKKNCYGASKYVKHLVFDKNTGEIIEAKSQLSLDEDKIAEEEKLDGYYAIVTSEMEKTDSEIIDIYRGLWRIEETFKVTKSELDDRPVYVSTKEHIEAHFLTCYLALVLCRVLQHKIDKKYSVEKILESLGKCCCFNLEENIYRFNFYDTVLKDIGNSINIDFSLKNRTLQDIKTF